MHLAERDANDSDVEHDAEKDVANPYPKTSNEEPQYIHEEVEATMLRLLFPYFRTEWPQRQYT